MKQIFGIFAIMLLLLSSIVIADTEDKETQAMLYDDYQVDGRGCYCPMPPLKHPKIDVVFVIDSTGSMGDEIREVKTHIENIVEEVEQGQPSPDLRVGVVTYRDYPEQEREYVFQSSRLTSNT